MSDHHDVPSANPDLICPPAGDSGITSDWRDDTTPADSSAIHPRALSRPAEKARPTGADSASMASELLPIVETVLRRWRRLLAWGMLAGLLGFTLGLLVWKKEYTAVAQLVRYDSPSAVDVFGYRQIAPQTFVGMFRSPELLRQVGARANPPVSAEVLTRDLRVMPEHNSDIFAVAVSGRSPDATVDLINLYAREAVGYTQKMQSDSSLEVSRYLQQQIAQLDAEILAVHGQNFPVTPVSPAPQASGSTAPQRKAVPAPRSSFLTARLEVTREELFELLTRYTDAHPLVVAQRAKIDAIEQQLRSRTIAAAADQTADTESESPAASPRPQPAPVALPVTATSDTDPEVMRSKLQSLENSRVLLVGRQRAAQSFADNPPGYFRLLAPAATKDLVIHGRKLKVIAFTLFCGVLGVASAAGLVVLREVVDDHLKTPADVKRVTRLPLLASLNDMNSMSPREQRDWAFRTWTSLQHNMSRSPNHGLVCGVTSAGEGEGRSTWVNLLAQEASQLGFRVLTIATRSSADSTTDAGETHPPAPELAGQPANSHAHSTAVAASNVLATPAEVTEKLTGPNPQPLVHIPLPGWVWNLERRKQWQAALNHWRGIDNIVILVELPPSDTPEAVLLAENLPNVIWLADSGKATAAETRTQLATLRHARCRLTGVVLNHAPKLVLQNRFPRWMEYAT